MKVVATKAHLLPRMVQPAGGGGQIGKSSDACLCGVFHEGWLVPAVGNQHPVPCLCNVLVCGKPLMEGVARRDGGVQRRGRGVQLLSIAVCPPHGAHSPARRGAFSPSQTMKSGECSPALIREGRGGPTKAKASSRWILPVSRGGGAPSPSRALRSVWIFLRRPRRLYLLGIRGRVCTARAQRAHDRKKLGVFATIGNILAYTNHTTPPQRWTA